MIGVSRGVITNIEYGKIQEPQPIITEAIVKTLRVRRDWFLTGAGEMEEETDPGESMVLSQLYDTAKQLTEAEQRYLLDVIKAMKTWLGKQGEKTKE
ncbi:MAG: transcriptional regulator [Clostridiales bacterium]|nr:transcriptional regulator [Clostridiales bacterium]